MSYWIPFRKKEDNRNKTAMLSLETMFRLHEIADDLASSGFSAAQAQKSIGFFCGFEKREDVKKMLPLDPPEVIRMKKREPFCIPSQKMFSEGGFFLTVKPEKPCSQPEEYFFPQKKTLPVFTVTGEIYPSGPCVSILFAIPGSPYGDYALS